MFYIIASLSYCLCWLSVGKELINSLAVLFFVNHLQTIIFMISLCMSSLASTCNIVHSKESGD